nr:hypothetical protein [Tanacetum cinerariifolium]
MEFSGASEFLTENISSGKGFECCQGWKGDTNNGTSIGWHSGDNRTHLKQRDYAVHTLLDIGNYRIYHYLGKELLENVSKTLNGSPRAKFMASDVSDQDARYALSKLLPMGTVAEYQRDDLTVEEVVFKNTTSDLKKDKDKQGKKRRKMLLITFSKVGANNPNGMFNDVGGVGYSKADGAWILARRIKDWVRNDTPRPEPMPNRDPRGSRTSPYGIKIMAYKAKRNGTTFCETHICGSSSQTHETGDVYLIMEELHQLHLDEEALREILEEQTMDEKAREEKIRQKQYDDDDEYFMEFGVMRIDSDYESSD